MTIIVGYVPKPEGRAAFQRAKEEAKLRDEDLIVLNFSRGTAYVDYSMAEPAEMASIEAELSEQGIRYEIKHSFSVDDIADEIIGAADRAGATMIVIGLRHRTAVGKLIMGSTAQRVLLDAPCDVLAVKAPRG